MFLATLPRTVCSSHCSALTPYLGPPLFLCPPPTLLGLWSPERRCSHIGCSPHPALGHPSLCVAMAAERPTLPRTHYEFCCCFSVAQLCPTLCNHRLQDTRLPCPSLSPRVCSNSCSLSQWCIQPSHPLSLLSPPALNLSQHQVPFPWVSSSHQAAEVLQLQLQHQSFSEYSGLIFFRIWLTGLISLLPKGLSRVIHHSSKASVLRCSAFSTVQLLYPYMTTGKTIALSIYIFVGESIVSAF